MKRLANMLVAGFAIAALSAPVLGVLGGVDDAVAQKKKAKASDSKRVKTYDFSGDDIDGDLVKPDGEFLDTRKFATHTSLIRIRKDFIREIVKSAEDL
jgi:hypothetical protein